MASMFRRNGVWYAKWFEGGKERRKSLKTRSIQRARARVVEIETAVTDGRSIDHTADCDVLTFTKEFLSFIETTKRPHTAKGLAHEWKNFTAWAKPLRLSDVTHETIQDYKLHLLEEGYAKSTVRSSLLDLSGVFRVAIRDLHRLEGENPVKGVGLPKPDVRFPRYLQTMEEIGRLLDAAEGHSRDMHLIMALGVFAGLRKNEIVNARWSWVDFAGQGRILIQPEGRFTTKNGQARKVPMTARLRPILERYRADDGAEFIIYPEQPEKTGTETTYRVDFTEAFATVIRNAGLEAVTPHTLRHTFASQLAIAGVSLFKIQTWLGHSDPKTTLIYSHLCPEDSDIDRFGS